MKFVRIYGILTFWRYPRFMASNIPSLDRFVRASLKSHQGIFFGESHEESAARSYILTQLPALRAQGVSTLYLEMPDNIIAAYLAGGEEKVAKITGKPARSFDEMPPTQRLYRAMILEAVQLGMRVIGHDARTDDGLGSEVASNSGLMQRDRLSAEVIQRTQDGGRYIVLGGLEHSRSATHDADLPMPGLPEQLGIPSVDFQPDPRALHVYRLEHGGSDATRIVHHALSAGEEHAPATLPTPQREYCPQLEAAAIGANMTQWGVHSNAQNPGLVDPQHGLSEYIAGIQARQSCGITH